LSADIRADYLSIAKKVASRVAMMALGADLMQSHFASPSQKISWTQKGPLKCAFVFQFRGCRGLICGFPDRRAISLLFVPRGASACAGESK
jgi:hypothetical protein